MRLIALLVVGRILIPLALVHPAWEFHRDELLYFAMGDHLAWRMQFPPFIALVARLGAEMFGDSIWAARVPAALGGGALTAVVLLLVHRLGGSRFALWIAWGALLASPVYVRPSVLLQPVVFDQLWAVTAVAALVMSAHESRPRWWIVVGAALGLGLLTKATAVMYGALVLLVTLAHPRLRPQLATQWPWVGAAMALLLGLPSLLGQMHFNWPFLAQLRVLESTQLAVTSWSATLGAQALMLGPALVLAAAGVWATRRSNLVTAAQVATAFAAALLATILWRGGKDYYAAPGYPVLIAVGAVWIGANFRPWARSAIALTTAGMAVIALPMGVPMLNAEAMAQYTGWLGVRQTTNRGRVLELPQDYADMFGWRELAAAVRGVLDELSVDEQHVTTIAAGNYGQAGALAMYRRRFQLSYPVSTAGDFHAWGSGSDSAEILLVVTGPDAREELEQLFGDVREVRRLLDPRRVPEEQDVRIWICRRPLRPLREVWPMIGPEWG